MGSWPGGYEDVEVSREFLKIYHLIEPGITVQRHQEILGGGGTIYLHGQPEKVGEVERRILDEMKKSS